MSDLFGTVAAAVGVFIGTDVDDLIVLTVLFVSARAYGKPRPWQIWAGQYAGIGVLAAISAVAALGLTIVPDRWVGLAGLIPLGLGIAGLVKAIRGGDDDEPPVTATGVVSIAAVTVANGADNISVYTPVFRSVGLASSLVMVVVFAAGVAVWCLLGGWLGSHRRVVAVAERFGHWLVPGVFILLGLVILGQSALFG